MARRNRQVSAMYGGVMAVGPVAPALAVKLDQQEIRRHTQDLVKEAAAGHVTTKPPPQTPDEVVAATVADFKDAEPSVTTAKPEIFEDFPGGADEPPTASTTVMGPRPVNWVVIGGLAFAALIVALALRGKE